LAVAMVAFVTSRTGELGLVYVLLAFAAAAALVAAVMLPPEREAPLPSSVPDRRSSAAAG
jgi:hypothetical protein